MDWRRIMTTYDKPFNLDQRKPFDKFIDALYGLESRFPDNLDISLLIQMITNVIAGVNEFRGNTNEISNFLDISDVEELILKTQGKLKSDVKEVFLDELSNLNEDWLIIKKKN
jgi:hypothetical protein